MFESFSKKSRNLALIKQRWPKVWSCLQASVGKARPCLVSDTPEPTLVIDGIHMSSGYDQLSEAKLQASLIPPGSRLGWVYGVGNGKVPAILLQRREIENLVVVVMNPSVLLQTSGYFDHEEWLSDPRVEVVLAEDQKDIHFPFTAIPSSLQLASDPGARLRDLVFLELSTPFIHARHVEQDEKLIYRLKENLDLIESSGDVAQLFGTRQGDTILVAAAGPTLAMHYKWLSTNTSKYLLIAVDAALKPLVGAGIFPDLVVTIDPYRDGVYPLFNGPNLSPLSKKTLVFFPVVHKDALELWPGPRLVSYSRSSFYDEIRERYPRGTLFCSGSVIHAAVDLAVKMGAIKVVLLGADFSFPYGKSHVEGIGFSPVKDESINPHWVLNGYGDKVRTTPNLRGYLRDLERYIARHTHVSFTNGSLQGAKIQGATYLEDNLDE